MKTLATILMVLCLCLSAESRPVFDIEPDNLPEGLGEETQNHSWESETGRFGGPCFKVSPGSAGSQVRFSLFKEPKPLPTPDRYRLETWLKSEGGEVRIDLVLFSKDWETEIARFPLVPPGRTVFSTSSNRAGSWEYYARDVPLDRDLRSIGYNIEIEVTGKPVRIDGLALAGSDSLLVNGDFKDPEALPFSPRPPKPIPRGWRRSYFEPDRSNQAEGTFSILSATNSEFLLVKKTEGKFVLSAEPLRLPSGVHRIVLRALAQPSNPALPSLIARQYGEQGLLREDRSSQTFALGSDRAISTAPLEVDPKADRILCFLSFPEREGEYRVKEVQLIPLSPPDKTPEILIDQVGYDSEEPLRFLVASAFYPESGTMSWTLSGENAPAIQGRLNPLGRVCGQNDGDWGWYYFEGFVPDPQEGVYSLEVSLDGETVQGGPVRIGTRLHLEETGELAYRFFYYQRCGCEVPGWHGTCHLDDAKLPDGSHADLRGGYHNAGDYHKHMGDNTPVAVYGMVTAYDRFMPFFDSIDRDSSGRSDLLEEVQWGADWMLKMVDPASGKFWTNVTNDIDYYGIPEKDTNGIVGDGDDRLVDTRDPSDLGAYAMAAWSVLFRCGGNLRYLQAAERAWKAYEARILESREPRLLIAAIELYRTTRKEEYRIAGEKIAGNLLEVQDPAGWFAGSPGGAPVFRIVDEGTLPAALALYALEWPSTEISERVREALRMYYTWMLRMADNPFGILRHYSEEEPFYFKKREEWFGGSNSAYCSLAWAASLASRVFAQDAEFRGRLEEMGSNQIHWVLGSNPLNLCMFEGKGNSERICFHHTYATLPGHPRGAVPGAIPNGIVRETGNSDRPWFDLRAGGGSPPGAESAEPWLPHNAYYLLMLSAKQ